MKKHFSRIFAVLLVVSVLFTQILIPASASDAHECTCETHDVNADTEINLTDVVLIVRYLAGGYSVTLK